MLFVNVPIGIAAARSPRACCAESRAEGARHFDVAGAVTVTAGLSLLVYALVDADNAGWGSTQTLGLVALALALLAPFVAIERARSDAAGAVPDLPAAHAHRREHRRRCWSATSLFSMFFFISLYMQQVLGYSALKAGLVVPAAGGRDHRLGRRRLAARHALGFKPVLVAGLLLIAGGLVWFSQVSVGRHLRRRRAGPVAARRRRARVRVRAGDDRRRGRGRGRTRPAWRPG